MTSLNVIENKISRIKKYLSDLARFRNYTREQIENDLLIQGASERFLYLLTQAAIDLAEAVVAYKNLRKPATLRESFEILRENNVISQELQEKMRVMVGFRNAMAHQYESIDYDIVFEVLQSRLADIEEFIEVIEAQVL